MERLEKFLYIFCGQEINIKKVIGLAVARKVFFCDIILNFWKRFLLLKLFRGGVKGGLSLRLWFREGLVLIYRRLTPELSIFRWYSGPFGFILRNLFVCILLGICIKVYLVYWKDLRDFLFEVYPDQYQMWCSFPEHYGEEGYMLYAATLVMLTVFCAQILILLLFRSWRAVFYFNWKKGGESSLGVLLGLHLTLFEDFLNARNEMFYWYFPYFWYDDFVVLYDILPLVINEYN